MSFRTRAIAAALLAFAAACAAPVRAQAPVQTSAQAMASPPDSEFYSLRESAAAGDTRAQFELGITIFVTAT